MKHSTNLNEICYPFILETSYLCDYEVATDELATLIGMALSSLQACAAEPGIAGLSTLTEELARVQGLAFHANGSVRGRLAVHEEDLAWLQQCLLAHRAQLDEHLPTFILPRGLPPVPQLHLARSACKKAIRCLVRLEQTEPERPIPSVLPRLLNLMCNYFFICTLRVNRQRGVVEQPFTSQSYGPVGRT